jgi:glycolate oxidase
MSKTESEVHGSDARMQMETIGDHRAPVGKLPTITSIIEAAHRNLPRELWDYLSGGAESEVTLHRNRAAFDRIAFRPRLMRGVEDRDTSTSFLGRHLDLPVMLAPVGSIARYHPDGALACARVAHRMGTIAFVSCMAAPALEEIRAATDAPLVLQLYMRGGRAGAEAEVRRAEAVGCVGVCLTADLAAPGHRERNLVNEFGGPRGAGPAGNPANPRGLNDLFLSNEALTWDDFGALRECTKLPFMVKGITCAEDARLAVEHGADVVYVSNHGGRQVDHVRAAIDALPEVVRAVNGRAEVIVDSGFVRGADVLKAIACGARAVLIGKLMGWGLGAAGEAGLERALELLNEEIFDLMAHLGVRRLEELGPDSILPAFAPPESAWIGFARGRD